MSQTLSFRTDNRTIRRLCDLQNRAGAEDFGDLFRRAIALYEVAVGQVQAGKRVLIEDPATGEIEEITHVVKWVDPDSLEG